MIKDTGGYAFPIPNADFQTFEPKTVDEYRRIQSGMNLRDYFAAKAMQGNLTNPACDSWDWEEQAKQAYKMADAMIAARNQ